MKTLLLWKVLRHSTSFLKLGNHLIMNHQQQQNIRVSIHKQRKQFCIKSITWLSSSVGNFQASRASLFDQFSTFDRKNKSGTSRKAFHSRELFQLPETFSWKPSQTYCKFPDGRSRCNLLVCARTLNQREKSYDKFHSCSYLFFGDLCDTLKLFLNDKKKKSRLKNEILLEFCGEQEYGGRA